MVETAQTKDEMWSLEHIRQELAFAHEQTRRVTSTLARRIYNYHGPHYGALKPSEYYDVANHGFDYVSIMLPQVVFNDPDIEISSSRGAVPRAVAKAQQAGMRRWVKDSAFIRKMELLAVDMFFGFCVALVKQRPNVRSNDIKRMKDGTKKEYFSVRGGGDSMLTTDAVEESSNLHWSEVCRVQPTMWGMDPNCTDYAEAAYAYHKFRRSKREMIAIAEEQNEHTEFKWELKDLRELKPNNTLDDTDRGGLNEPGMRDDLYICEMWVKHHSIDTKKYNADEGYHGTIFTLALRNKDDVAEAIQVRAPRPFYGPRWGPYRLGGVYPVPDSPIPLGPLVVSQQQSEDLNAAEKALTESARDYKKLIALNASEEADFGKLNRAVSGHMIKLQSVERGMPINLEIGGVTDQQILHVERMRDRLERTSGLTDNMRGNVTGNATASENLLANDAAMTRAGYVDSKIEQFAAEVLRSVGWYLFHDDNVVFPLALDDFADQEDIDELEAEGADPSTMHPMFEGGNYDRSSGYTYDDLELTIKVGSMRRQNTVRKRQEFAELFQTSMAIVQTAPMFPWVQWSEIMKDLGDMYEQGDWHERFDFAQAGQSLPFITNEPKQEGQVGAPKDSGPKVTVNAGGGRGGASKPAVPKAMSGANNGGKPAGAQKAK